MADNLQTHLLLALMLYTPAAIANMAPVILWRTGSFKILRRPLDGGLIFCGQPLFGSHKTVFGLMAAVFGGMAGGLLAGYAGISQDSQNNVLWFVLWGGGIGLAAILGDLMKSFIKRRFRIKAGRPFIPWDQVDFVIGAWMGHQVIYTLLQANGFSVLPPIGWQVLLLGVLIIPPLHLLANLIAYKMRWKKVWW